MILFKISTQNVLAVIVLFREEELGNELIDGGLGLEKLSGAIG